MDVWRWISCVFRLVQIWNLENVQFFNFESLEIWKSQIVERWNSHTMMCDEQIFSFAICKKKRKKKKEIIEVSISRDP